MKIYKASVESFAVEVSEGKTADAGLPVVYLQVVQRGKNASLTGGGTPEPEDSMLILHGGFVDGHLLVWGESTELARNQTGSRPGNQGSTRPAPLPFSTPHEQTVTAIEGSRYPLCVGATSSLLESMRCTPNPDSRAWRLRRVTTVDP